MQGVGWMAEQRWIHGIGWMGECVEWIEWDGIDMG